MEMQNVSRIYTVNIAVNVNPDSKEMDYSVRILMNVLILQKRVGATRIVRILWEVTSAIVRGISERLAENALV